MVGYAHGIADVHVPSVPAGPHEHMTMAEEVVHPLPDYADALRHALEGVTPLPLQRVTLANAAGRVLAEDIKADRDWPPFDRATMDGYALRSADLALARPLQVVGEIAAGASTQIELAPGQCCRVATGARVPSTSDAIVPHEFTDRGVPHVAVSAAAHLQPGDNIHRQGSDARAGQRVISAGTDLGAHHVGLCAGFGVSSPLVHSRPKTAVLTTGDEVLPPECTSVLPYQIRNSNGPMLTAALTAMGCSVISSRHVRDDPDSVRAAVLEAMAEADVLITAGGVSAGDRDFLPGVLEDLGVKTRLRGAAIQPGRPITVGRVAAKPGKSVEIVLLPGNPVSVLATAHLFAWPIFRALSGFSPLLPWIEAAVSGEVRPNPRRQAFRPAMFEPDNCSLTVPKWGGSGDLVHTVGTHGLAAIPLQERPVERGEKVPFLPWAWHSVPHPRKGPMS